MMIFLILPRLFSSSNIYLKTSELYLLTSLLLRLLIPKILQYFLSRKLEFLIFLCLKSNFFSIDLISFSPHFRLLLLISLSLHTQKFLVILCSFFCLSLLIIKVLLLSDFDFNRVSKTIPMLGTQLQNTIKASFQFLFQLSRKYRFRCHNIDSDFD